MEINGAVEGYTDEAVWTRIIQTLGADTGLLQGKQGKKFILDNLTAFNSAAHFGAWFVLIDLDQDDDCAPELKIRELPHPARYMSFRVAVREVESWLLADRDRIAKCLRVPISLIPELPEDETNPKASIVNLAKSSRSEGLKADLVPSKSGMREVGPGYHRRMVEFAMDPHRGWRPNIAARVSPSLDKCISNLKCVISRYEAGNP